MNIHSLVIAGLKGSSGKTFISLGLVSAFANKGVRVAVFKKGPDYIDAGWLAGVAGRPCYTLDPFLIGRDKVLSSFISHSRDTDLAIVEGNRGLFDGIDVDGEFSTAEVAKTLQSPVILVVDCLKATRTIAAILLGVLSFDKKLRIEGVILNRIAGSRHESVIRKAIEKYCNIQILGAVPNLAWENFPERHMGLKSYPEHPEVKQAIYSAADIVSRHVNLDKLLEIAGKGQVEMQNSESGIQNPEAKNDAFPTLRIGVIKDSAFQFYYPENLEELKRHGAEIVEISALEADRLPEIDALYIGGGFPETHAPALSDNKNFRAYVGEAVRKGLPVYAECGGLMYLGESLVMDDKNYSMTGIFPISFSIEKKPQAHGYTIVEVVRENPFYPVGTILRGHEFHYSKSVNTSEVMESFNYAFRVNRGSGIYKNMDGLCHKNVFATYTHLHAYGARQWVEGMIKQATAHKNKKNQSDR